MRGQRGDGWRQGLTGQTAAARGCGIPGTSHAPGRGVPGHAPHCGVSGSGVPGAPRAHRVPGAPGWAGVALGRKGGLKGGRARMDSLTVEERRKLAEKAAKARWGK